MRKLFLSFLVGLFISPLASADATPQQVVDIPTRPGVTQRMLVVSPPSAKASVILFAGGHGGLQISPSGAIHWGDNNFVVRTRQMFAEHGLQAVVVDAPSDRQSQPYLNGFRQTPEHVADIKAVIAWLRAQSKLPVWLVGTSRGTQSAAFVATQLTGSDAPDGLVLTSTILTDAKSRPVTAMDLANLTIPVLVVHHERDGCKLCSYSRISDLMDALKSSPRKQLITASGGLDLGDPCEPKSHHGFNGLDGDVVAQISDWIAPH